MRQRKATGKQQAVKLRVPREGRTKLGTHRGVRKTKKTSRMGWLLRVLLCAVAGGTLVLGGTQYLAWQEQSRQQVTGLDQIARPEELSPDPAKQSRELDGNAARAVPRPPPVREADLAEVLESPQTQPTHPDLVAELGHDVLWQLGTPLADERPGDPGEDYQPERNTPEQTQVVHFDAKDLSGVPGLGPDQSVVLSLPALPQRNLRLRAILSGVGDFSAEPLHPWRMYELSDAVASGRPATEGEFVRIRFNDHLIWSRWRTGFEYSLDAFIPEDILAESGNTLVIENNSSTPLRYQCIWIEEASPGDRLWVALSDADWVTSRTVAEWLPTIALRLPLEKSRNRGVPAIGVGEKGNMSSAFPSLGERRQALMEKLRTEGIAVNGTEREWQERIMRVLQLDAEPVIALDVADPNLVSLDKLSETYGRFVHFWRIEASSPETAAEVARIFRGRAPQAHLSLSPFPRVEGVTASPLVLPRTFGYRVATQCNQIQRTLLAQGITAAASQAPWLVNHRLNTHHSKESQWCAARNIPEEVISWLDAGGGGITLRGGEGGGVLFFQGCRRPAAMWDSVKLLTAVGDGDARRIPCNLTPGNGRYGTTQTRWVAVQHDEQRVSVLIFAGDDEERNFEVCVPVPWAGGDTHVAIRAVDLPRKREPVAADTQKLRISAVPASSSRGSCGIARLEVKLPTMCLIRLWPRNAQIARRRIQPNTTRSFELEDTHFVDALLRLVRPTTAAGVWFEEVRSADEDCMIFGSREEVAVKPATPGTLGKCENVAPWASESTVITFHSPGPGPQRPFGVELPLLYEKYPNADRLRFWVRASSSTGSKTVTLAAGVREVLGSIVVPTDQWHCLETDWRRLFPPNIRPWPFLRLWPVPDLPEFRCGGSVVFELNGFVAAGEHTPEGRDVSGCLSCRQLPVDRRMPQLLTYMIVGRPGTALWHEMRFRDATLVHDVQASCQDFSWRYEPETRALRLAFPEIPEHMDGLGRWSRQLDAREHALCNAGKGTPIAIRVRKQK